MLIRDGNGLMGTLNQIFIIFKLYILLGKKFRYKELYVYVCIYILFEFLGKKFLVELNFKNQV